MDDIKWNMGDVRKENKGKMGEFNPYRLNDFEWEVLQVYLKHGYGDVKLYHTLFFCASLNDETALLTLGEFAEKAVDFEDNLWIEKNKTE